VGKYVTNALMDLPGDTCPDQPVSANNKGKQTTHNLHACSRGRSRGPSLVRLTTQIGQRPTSGLTGISDWICTSAGGVVQRYQVFLIYLLLLLFFFFLFFLSSKPHPFWSLLNTANARITLFRTRASNARCRLILRLSQRHCRALWSRSFWPA
jgi:hypothetical protein